MKIKIIEKSLDEAQLEDLKQLCRIELKRYVEKQIKEHIRKHHS